ncbi:transposase [Streptomyces sp. NPDC001406]|uniref:transposase n=1 Tax=Streptomyces sp. NPDC001406 TaxID=3364572 RepID=UPI0036848161
MRCYGSDLTEAEWQVVRPLLPVPAWFQGRGGRPESYCHHVMLDAVRYVVDNGVKWASLPADFPPYRRVHAFARRWPPIGARRSLQDGRPGGIRMPGSSAEAGVPIAARPRSTRSAARGVLARSAPSRPRPIRGRAEGDCL